MQETVTTIIFSKDRASQLDLLLYSIFKNIEPVEALKISVIYICSDSDFKKGYQEILIPKYPNVNFVEQGNDFKNDVMKLLESELSYTMFFVDDCVVFRTFDILKAVETLKDDNIFCFSPRLSANVTKCYTLSCPNVLVPDNVENGIVKWNWQKSYADFSYPLSLDAHIFRTKEIKKMVRAISFTNPNYLEGGLASTFDSFPKDQMAAFSEHNVVLGIPNNIVNSTAPNLHAQTYGITAKELNDKYLAGEIIDLESLSFENITGCHQEVEYKFKNIIDAK